MKKGIVEARLDNIEEILKMLLANSVLGSSDVEKYYFMKKVVKWCQRRKSS